MPSRSLLIVAWATTLLLSRLPEIILREAFGWDMPWINLAWIAIAIGLIGVASVLPLVRPLRAYLIVMLTVLVLTTIIDPFIRGALFRDIAPADTDPELRRLFAERALLAAEALAIIPILAALGYRRGDAYLALGRLTAPSGLHIAGRSLSWVVVGPIAAILLVLATVSFASAQVTPTADLWSRAMPLLPIAWAAAALNAFSERSSIEPGSSDRSGASSDRRPASGSSRSGSVLAISTAASRQA